MEPISKAFLRIKNIKTNWDLSLIYKDEQDPKIAKQRETFEKTTRAFINKWKDNTDYLTKPEVLKEALDEITKINDDPDKDYAEGYYYSLKNALDQTNTDITAKLNKIIDFITKLANELEFFDNRLSKISKEKQDEFLASPILTDYHKKLKKLFETGKYTLSEDQEKIVNLLGKPALSNWVEMTQQFLSKEETLIADEENKEITATIEKLLSLVCSKNKKVRDQAGVALNKIFEKNSNVAEHELNSVLEYKKIQDELRGYKRADEDRLIDDDMDTQVVDSLVAAVSTRFDISKRFYEFKAKLLGQEKLEYYERSADYGNVDKKYSFEEAANITYQTFNQMDPEFGSIFKEFIENGQIDASPAKGKGGGAFCAHDSTHAPIYVLLNHTDKIRDVAVMAHEMGHAINYYLSFKKQPSRYATIPVSIGEVASTFMEDFVAKNTITDTDDETKLTLMVDTVEDSIATVIRQIACYKLETDLHAAYKEKGYLSKKEIGELFLKNMKNYMGDYVNFGPGSENWWVYWSHIRTFFYVYSYASGLLISKALQKMVREDPKNMAKVKEILSAGSSMSPKDLFATVGIDITDSKFWDQGLDEIDQMLSDAQNLARKLGKIA